MAQDIGEKLKSILSDPKMMESFSRLIDSGEGKTAQTIMKMTQAVSYRA